MQRWQLVGTIPPSRHAIATNQHPGWGVGGGVPMAFPHRNREFDLRQNISHPMGFVHGMGNGKKPAGITLASLSAIPAGKKQ